MKKTFAVALAQAREALLKLGTGALRSPCPPHDDSGRARGIGFGVEFTVCSRCGSLTKKQGRSWRNVP